MIFSGKTLSWSFWAERGPKWGVLYFVKNHCMELFWFFFMKLQDREGLKYLMWLFFWKKKSFWGFRAKRGLKMRFFRYYQMIAWNFSNLLRIWLRNKNFLERLLLHSVHSFKVIWIFNSYLIKKPFSFLYQGSDVMLQLFLKKFSPGIFGPKESFAGFLLEVKTT